MKITYLALHLGYGGVERSIVDRANLLSEKYDVEIFVTYKLFDKPAFEVSDKVKITYLTDLKPNKSELFNSIKKFKISQIIKHSIYSIRLLYTRRKSMIDVIRNTEDGVIISTKSVFTNLLSKYGKKNVVKMAEEHDHHNKNVFYLYKVRYFTRGIDYFLPVSKELTSFYEKFLKIKVKYIPHFVDFPEVNFSKLNNQTVISVGRLSKEKGFEDLIEVFNIASKVNPNLRLKIAGDGNEKTKIIEKINEYNLSSKVELLGFIDQKKLTIELENSSLYVMTSHIESFGLVLLEAMNFGIPCIAFDSAQGANEIIQNGVNGWLIENRSFDIMAEKINEYFKSDKKTISKGAIETAQKYSKNNISKEWFEFLKEVSCE